MMAMMNIKSKSLDLFIFVIALLLPACSDIESNIEQETDKGVELSGLQVAMSRAEGSISVAELKDYVGRSEFSDKDRAVFGTIKRTDNPIDQFTYSDIEFICSASTTEDGKTGIGWSRDKEKGKTESGNEFAPDRIYWSDAIHEHTFIGYCAPQQGPDAKAFDWKENSGVYYGSLGDPTLTGEGNNTIDFRSTFNQGVETLSGNVELCKNDILLTYSTKIKADDAIANILFYHGLAQVRVIVNISDFAAGGGDDTKSVVSDMILKDMLTMYKWRQTSVATEKLDENDASALNSIYSTNTPSYNQRKNVNLWIPDPQGVGEKSSRTFTFYGLAVPTSIATDSPLQFSFNVTYPDPMKPTSMKTHTYNASISDIKFDAGKCTTITISLNHKNEKMTIGAEYDDWDFVDTPDQGELKKNVTFMTSTERIIKPNTTNYYNVTIIGDANATADDATWLYVDTKENNKIKDIYGNDGSEGKPFQISTAEQLLSFAYEVKGTNRTSATYTDLDNDSHNLSESFDFSGYYVALDAGITLQPNETKTKLEYELANDFTSDAHNSAPNPQTWIGIGESGKPFNGTLLGGVRFISRLYGSPFFVELGPQAHIDQLILEDVIGVQGDGGFANINKGTICACKVDGNVKSETTGDPVGSFVGTNYGLIFACYHIGDLEATGADIVGGLVGCNGVDNQISGKIVASYNAGKITANKTWKNGVLGMNNVSGVSVFGCFYDRTKANNVSSVAPVGSTSPDYPSAAKSTVELMKSSFVGLSNSTTTTELNGVINTWSETYNSSLHDHLKARYYVSQPASYPTVY